MPISINRSGDVNSRVEPPIIRIVGKFIKNSSGGWAEETREYNTQHEVISSGGLSVRARVVDAFKGSVTVIIGGYLVSEEVNPSGNITQNAGETGVQPKLAVFSKAAAGSEFTGEQAGNSIQNENAYIYYTLNGKDPKQTKANLYKGAIKVNQNASGTDNYILKARVYINGISSEVRKVEFRIVGNQSNYRDVNKSRS